MAANPAPAVTLPAGLMFVPPPPATVIITPTVPTEITASLALGLPGEAGIYLAVMPVVPAPVCTEAIFPSLLPSDSPYAFSHSQLNYAALKAAFQHDGLVKMMRNFVPGQPLPDAPSYVPLTTQQKFDAFLRNSHSVGLAVGILSDAVISQVTGAYPRFGGGMEGFGQRLGVSAAGAEAGAFIGGFVYPTLFHQDPRYFRSHQSSIADRLAYAASRVFIGRSDDGRSVINTSVIASQFTQAAISNAYIPYRNESVTGTIENALTGLGGVAEGDILNEFWPDIKEFVMRHTHNHLVQRGMDLGDPNIQYSNVTPASGK